MTTSTLTRSQRAMQIERRTWKSWQPGAAAIRIPSQSQSGVVYTVTPTSCSCADAFYHGTTCKHQIAARIFLGRIAARIFLGRSSG